jgi:hypothetical protein
LTNVETPAIDKWPGFTFGDFVVPYKTSEEKAAHMREWRENNPEKAKEIRSAYYTRNAEKIKAKERTRREANKEKDREKSRRARAKRSPEQIETQKQRQRKWYLQNREKHHAQGLAWQRANRDKMRGYYLAWERRDPKRTMVQRAKHGAKSRGLEFAITVDNLIWPTHCPILGIELCYDRDKKTPHRDNYPTFDRWDNNKGYVPGNVFVISWLANRMKWHATVEQLEAILRYMKERPSVLTEAPKMQVVRNA